MTERHEVCPADDLPPGDRRIVEVSGLSIGVFNVDGEYYGLANVCPHQLAQLCRGELGAEVTSSGVGEYTYQKEGQIVRCPRHRWAFDVTTGESVFNPHLKTRTFDVAVESVEPGGDGTAGDGTAGDGTAGDGTAGDGTVGDGTAGDGDLTGDCRANAYGTDLAGDEPPVDTYDVAVEDDVVVLYV